jgi:hypothetical protein
MKELVGEIPDAIFDFYCRFIPGAYILVLVYSLSDLKPIERLPVGNMAISAFTVAFILGHALQPISSAFARFAESVIDSNWELRKLYKKEKQKHPDGTRLQKLVSKAYCEAVSMAAMALGSVLVNFYFMAQGAKDTHPLFLWAAFVTFFLFSLERLRARARKIRDLNSASED